MLNQAVKHRAFGGGIVQNVDEQHITVIFDKDKTSRVFAYPSCFDGFLSVENAKLQEQVLSALGAWKQESGAEQKEALRLSYEKTVRGIEARRITAEEKKMKAARKAMEHRIIGNMNREARDKKMNQITERLNNN